MRRSDAGAAAPEVQRDVDRCKLDCQVASVSAGTLRQHVHTLAAHAGRVSETADALALASGFSLVAQLSPGVFDDRIQQVLEFVAQWLQHSVGTGNGDLKRELESCVVSMRLVLANCRETVYALLGRWISDMEGVVASQVTSAAAALQVSQAASFTTAAGQQHATVVKRHSVLRCGTGDASSHLLGLASCYAAVQSTAGEALAEYNGLLMTPLVAVGVASLRVFNRWSAWLSVMCTIVASSAGTAAQRQQLDEFEPVLKFFVESVLSCQPSLHRSWMGALSRIAMMIGTRAAEQLTQRAVTAMAYGSTVSVTESPTICAILDGFEALVGDIAAPLDPGARQPDPSSTLQSLLQVVLHMAGRSCAQGRCLVFEELLLRGCRRAQVPARADESQRRVVVLLFAVAEKILLAPETSAAAVSEAVRDPAAWVGGLPAAGASADSFICTLAEVGAAAPRAAADIPSVANLAGRLHDAYTPAGSIAWRVRLCRWLSARMQEGEQTDNRWFGAVWPFLSSLVSDAAADVRAAGAAALGAAAEAAADERVSHALWELLDDDDAEVRWVALGPFARQVLRQPLQYPCRGTRASADVVERTARLAVHVTGGRCMRMMDALRVAPGQAPWILRAVAASGCSAADSGRTGLFDAIGSVAVGTALFCVRERLRTPVGTAKQTFEELEQALRLASAQSVMLNDEVYDKLREYAKAVLAAHPPPPPPPPSGDTPASRLAALAEHQDERDGSWQMQNHNSRDLVQQTALVLLIAELERWTYLAQEGYSAEFDSRANTLWQPTASQFFVGNRRVCDDYFAKFRSQTVAACSTVPSPVLDSVLLRNHALRLQDLKQFLVHQSRKPEGLSTETRVKAFTDMERSLLGICCICVRKGAADVIVGFQAFAKHLTEALLCPPSQSAVRVVGAAQTMEQDRVPGLWSVMRGMAAHSAGSYEDALAAYERVFSVSGIRSSQLMMLRVASEHLVDCCVHTWSWGRLANWAAAVKDSITQLAEQRPADGKEEAALERKCRFLFKEVVSAHERSQSSAATPLALTIEYARALSKWHSGESQQCLADISAVDTKATALVNCMPEAGTERLASAIATPPALHARIRVLHALCVASHQPQELPQAAAALRCTADRLQTALAWESSAAEMLHAHVLQMMADRPAPHVYRLAEAVLLFGEGATAFAQGEGQSWSGLRHSHAVLSAARAARKAGNLEFASRVLQRADDSLSRQYESAMLRIAQGAVQQGVAGLWQVAEAAGQEAAEIGCRATLRLQQLTGDSEEAAQALSSELSVPAADVRYYITTVLATKYTQRRDAWQRYAETHATEKLSEHVWGQTLSAHLTALNLGGGTPLQDMKLALRTLQLLVQGAQQGYAPGDARTALLTRTPPSVWRDISPQLLATLTSPNAELQRVVMMLLAPVGEAEPLLLLYPLIAILNSPKRTMFDTFTRLWRAVCDGSTAAVFHSTQDFVSELVHVAGLLDEDVAAAVSNVSHSLSRVMPSYRAFVKQKLGAARRRGLANEHKGGGAKFNLLKRQKYQALIAPLKQAMEAVIQKVAAEPRCHHDADFRMDNLPRLSRTLHVMRSTDVPLDAADFDGAVADVHQNIASVVSSLSRAMSEYDKRTQVLSLSEISPKLSRARDTGIPMPGTISGTDPVTIQKLEADVEVIMSKTRPKKLQFWGSDGKRYTFLLKGKEDLSLDERVMQFLGVCAQLLGESYVARTRGLRCQAYAVVPLSERSGLIRFVDNVKQVFHLHRQWHKRQSVKAQCAAQTSAQRPQRNQKAVAGFRPVHSFFNKLLPALEDVGITNVGSRAEWPAEVLTKVFKELTSEVPRDLLTRELWHSGSLVLSDARTRVPEAGQPRWLSRTRTFATSLAVMSMIGYIIGLGDRHLDNILIDFETGQVTHIDYNICFEKGLHLRVPEVVPFRLTPVLLHSLGVQGIEGTYRSVCEETMSVMRGGKDILLALLFAFVHDPLVEWASKRAREPATDLMEVRVALSVLTSQLDEVLGDFTDTVSRTASRVQAVALTVADFGGCRQAELIHEIREKDAQVAECQEAIKRLKEDHISAAKDMTLDDLRQAVGCFDALQTTLREQELANSKVQDECDEVLESVRAGSIPVRFDLLPVMPSAEVLAMDEADPLQEGGSKLPPGLLSAAGRCETQERLLMSALNAAEEPAKQMSELLCRWGKIVTELERGRPGLQYTRWSYSEHWRSVYQRLQAATREYTEGGTAAEMSYRSFVDGAEAAMAEIRRVADATVQEQREHTSLAPGGVNAAESRDTRASCAAAVSALESEAQAAAAARAQGSHLLRALVEARDELNTDLDTGTTMYGPDPEARWACMYACSGVLSQTLDTIGKAPQPTGLQPPKQSWERAVTLAEMEETDDNALLLLHLKWSVLGSVRLVLSVADAVVHVCKGRVSREAFGVALQLASRTAATLTKAVQSIERATAAFVPWYWALLGKAGDSAEAQADLRSSFAADASQRQGDAADLLQSLADMKRELQETVVGGGENGQGLDRFLAAEEEELLRTLLDDVTRTPLYGSVHARHQALRRGLTAMRSLATATVENFVLDPARQVTEQLRFACLQDFAADSAMLTSNQDLLMLMPVGVSNSSQVEHFAEAVCSFQGLGPAERQERCRARLRGVREQLERVVRQGEQHKAASLTQLSLQFLDSTQLYASARAELRDRALRTCWLYDPLCPDQRSFDDGGPSPLGLPSRGTFVRLLTSLHQEHATALRELDAANHVLATEDERNYARHVRASCTPDVDAAVQRAVERRSRETSAILRMHHDISDAVRKVVYLEVLRDVSDQNTQVQSRVQEHVQRSLDTFSDMVRTRVGVLHRKERTRDIEKDMRQLSAQERRLLKESDKQRRTLDTVQSEASAATRGTFAELQEVQPEYQARTDAALKLLHGAARTLSQFAALRRLHGRLNDIVDQLQVCQQRFTQWMDVFTEMFGGTLSAVTDPIAALLTLSTSTAGATESERIAEAVDEFTALNNEAISNLEELASVGESVAQGEDIPWDEDTVRQEDEQERAAERSHHAVGVLMRVAMKLDGRDDGSLRSRAAALRASARLSADAAPPAAPETRLSVPDQVRCVISEATRLENNLAMYEGWTAWI